LRTRAATPRALARNAPGARRARPPSPSLPPPVGALAVLQVGCCIAIICTTALDLEYSSAARPHKSCLMGEAVTGTAPCGFAIAFGSISLAAALLLLAALSADYAMHTAKGVAQVAAARVRERACARACA
jgi:hypothetical protein